MCDSRGNSVAVQRLLTLSRREWARSIRSSVGQPCARFLHSCGCLQISLASLIRLTYPTQTSHHRVTTFSTDHSSLTLSCMRCLIHSGRANIFFNLFGGMFGGCSTRLGHFLSSLTVRQHRQQCILPVLVFGEVNQDLDDCIIIGS